MSDFQKKLVTAFNERQAYVLNEVLREAFDTLARASDFRELKDVIGELMAIQQRTEQNVERLIQIQEKHIEIETRNAVYLEQLIQAQMRTEARLDELAYAQARTETRLEELVRGLPTLTNGLDDTPREVSNLRASVNYALENEAFRKLPDLLQERYAITLSQPLIRAEIGGYEIDLFGQGTHGKQFITLVGAIRLRLDEYRGRGEHDVFEELEQKIQAVMQETEVDEVIRVLVTHYATRGILQQAQERGILVIQSFEW
jgi:hypothetical protein